jgi:hypothetical protein
MEPGVNRLSTTRTIVVALGVAAFVSACGTSGSSHQAAPESSASSSAVPLTFNVGGSLALVGSRQHIGRYGACSGSGGYDDLANGAQVSILDNTGKTIGLGELENGSRGLGSECDWTFVVRDVPDTEGPDGIYSVEVTHRGKVSFKRSEASLVKLSIGD